ncbi:hypothetical protein Patl1_26548 [Pistacia atlantica]|uniref:Uncharacterized protein n=1 Tax=Pistacia atlantica TaxID=434234 RepID=A0ACC1B291_9ROSI|nr:hypothetical protein Patl1_26548 [Pistacia atlantica]
MEIGDRSVIAIDEMTNILEHNIYPTTRRFTDSLNMSGYEREFTRLMPGPSRSWIWVQSFFYSRWCIIAEPILPITTNNSGGNQMRRINEETEARRGSSYQIKLNAALLAITAQGGVGMFSIGESSTLSPNGMFLLRSAVACNFTGFMSCLYAILLNGRKPEAARILSGTGCVATVYGFLALMGTALPDRLMWMSTAVSCLASFPAIAVFAKKTDFPSLFRH